jgi:hypothetical protein
VQDSLTRVSELRVKLYVSDYLERRAFYGEIIGWPVVSEWNRGPGKRGVMFNTGSAILELLEHLDAMPQPGGCDVSLMVSDVWSLWEILKGKATVVFPLRKNAWGDSSFCVADPGSFRLTFFTVTEDK